MSKVRQAGWTKVLTQVEIDLWTQLKARCFREGNIPPCEGVNRALRAWVESEQPTEPPGVVPQRGEWF